MQDVNEQMRADAKLYDLRAATYGTDPDDLEHSISKGLEEPYQHDLEEVLGRFEQYHSVLEVGAGNGVLTRLLDKWGCNRIVGIDISEGMIEQARIKLPQCAFQVIATETDPDLLPANSYDLIISRQVACHLLDPIGVFECWKRWLKPGGRIAVIDALWTRKDWGPPNSPAGALVDQRPLSCTQTWATVCYMLKQAGFKIIECKFLERVNAYGKERFTIGETREPIFRYIVVAETKD